MGCDAQLVNWEKLCDGMKWLRELSEGMPVEMYWVCLGEISGGDFSRKMSEGNARGNYSGRSPCRITSLYDFMLWF